MIGGERVPATNPQKHTSKRQQNATAAARKKSKQFSRMPCSGHISTEAVPGVLRYHVTGGEQEPG